MEGIAIGLVLIALVVAIVALAIAAGHGNRVSALQRELETLRKEVAALRETAPPVLASAPAPAPASASPAPEVAAGPPEAERVERPETEAPPAAVGAPSPVAAPVAAPATVAAPPSASPSASGASSEVAAPAKAAQPSHRAELDALERRVGQRWTTWTGAAALVVGAVLFVRYAFEQGWLGPAARIAAGLGFGVVLLGIGDRFVRKGFRPLGQGLMGAGQAVLYGTLWAAWALYALVSRDVAFAGMVAVTLGGMALAVRHDALATSLIALLGGFATPALVSTGSNPRDALFAYILLLDVGALAVAWWRGWRWLDLVASAGTWLLVAAWTDSHYASSDAIPVALWAAGFHVVLSWLPLAANLVRRTPPPPERTFLPPANLGLALLWAWGALTPVYETALGIATLIAAGGQVALALLIRRRVPDGLRAVSSVAAGATIVAYIAAPLLLPVKAVAVAWAAGAPVLFLLGRLGALPVLREGTALALAAAVLRLLDMHFPLHDGPFGLPIANAPFVPVLLVALAAFAVVAVRLLRRSPAESEDGLLDAMREGDLFGALRQEGWIAAACGHAGAGLVLVLGHADVADWLGYAERYDAIPWATGLLWAVGAVAYLAALVRFRRLHLWVASLLVTAVALVLSGDALVAAVDPPAIPFLSGPFLVSLIATLVTFALAWAARRAPLRHAERAAFGLAWTATALLFVFLSLESWRWLYLGEASDVAAAAWRAQLGLSVLWSVYAATLLAIGFRRRVRWVRLTGLAVFGLTAAKLVLFDLSGVAELYRILSFLAVGFVLFGASWGYHRAERRWAADADESSA